MNVMANMGGAVRCLSFVSSNIIKDAGLCG